jgi:hypothetical protein
MFKYELSKGNDGDLILLRNNKPMNCPLQQRGEVVFLCGAWCPKFDITWEENPADIEGESIYYATQACGCEKTKYKIPKP